MLRGADRRANRPGDWQRSGDPSPLLQLAGGVIEQEDIVVPRGPGPAADCDGGPVRRYRDCIGFPGIPLVDRQPQHPQRASLRQRPHAYGFVVRRRHREAILSIRVDTVDHSVVLSRLDPQDRLGREFRGGVVSMSLRACTKHRGEHRQGPQHSVPIDHPFSPQFAARVPSLLHQVGERPPFQMLQLAQYRIAVFLAGLTEGIPD